MPQPCNVLNCQVWEEKTQRRQRRGEGRTQSINPASLNSPASLYFRMAECRRDLPAYWQVYAVSPDQHALEHLSGQQFTADAFQVNQTKPEFTGDYTVVLFSLIKSLKKSPDQLGNELGTYLVKSYPDFYKDYNVIKGFLNLSVVDEYWLNLLSTQYSNASYGRGEKKKEKVMVEYSSPNTNKPLHLGHLRNNFLGWSIAEILKARGHGGIGGPDGKISSRCTQHFNLLIAKKLVCVV